MKIYLFIAGFFCSAIVFAQGEAEGAGKEFRKENLFTGGSITLSFGSGQFIGGLNPVLGYSITRWLDGGIVINYTYASQRDYNTVYPSQPTADQVGKLRQSVYGGGIFTRVFPVRFIFLQGQAEHNFINLKFTSLSGNEQKFERSANSLLVGGGYTTGREPDAKKPYAYVAILFDIGGDDDSPYIEQDATGRNRPQLLYRAGFHIPLFQGKGNR